MSINTNVLDLLATPNATYHDFDNMLAGAGLPRSFWAVAKPKWYRFELSKAQRKGKTAAEIAALRESLYLESLQK
jgi:hypothetical protein